MIEDRLLGFDVRELWINEAALWDSERRERFLLRLDVMKPRSVDTLVWPSVFDTGQGIGMPESERERWHLAGVPVPSWIGHNAGLWNDLEQMRRHLAERWGEPRPHAVVAVSWFSDCGFAEAGGTGPHPATVTPPTRDRDWKLLGFDVADGSLLSALSNCGYSPLEARHLRRHWCARLNSRHLFSRLEHALEFRELADSRVPEHAPFFVYGLFLIEEVWIT